MSEIWKRKMRTYISIFDYDNDGVISKDDWDKMPILYANFEKADKQKAEHLKIQFDNLWEQFLKKADTADKNLLTAETLMDSVRKQRNDPELKKRISDLVHGLFDLLDVNCDGYLQEDEHRRIYDQLGVPDSSFAKEAFKAIDVDGDGKLSMEECVNACLDFFFSEDEKNPNTLYFGPLVD